MLSLIPDSLKQALLDGLVNFLAGQADRLTDNTLGRRLREFTSDGALRKAMDAALRRVQARFEHEYGSVDGELVADIRGARGFWDNNEVRRAIMELVARPGAWGEIERSRIVGHFTSVLPTQPNRDRVDGAVSFLLRCAAEEIWSIPAAKEIREVYTLQMQRHTVDVLQRQVELAEQKLRANPDVTGELRESLLALLEAQRQQLLLPQPSKVPLSHPRPWHNLPPAYESSFVGRSTELARLRALLSPSDRAWQILILGIGGVGKSALARAIAHEYRERYEDLPLEERFEAIIWVSAKQEVLTADGSEPAAPEGLIFRTLDDIYAAVAQVLDRGDLVQASSNDRDRIAQQALAAQRSLLIVDNFESVVDARVSAFLRHLPPPTKALVTSREWLDAAAVIRLEGLADADAVAYVSAEAARRDVQLTAAEVHQIVTATGGLPLPLRLAVARLASGERAATVLRWLGSATADLPAYCVQSQAELARAQDARSWPLLITCALCDLEAGASRATLATAAAVDADTCDDVAARLQRLSLVNPLAVDRLTLLPMVERYILGAATPNELEQVGRRWLDVMLVFARDVAARLDLQIDLVETVAREYPNLRAAITWCRERGLHAQLLALVEHSWFYAELVGRFDELQTLYRAALEAAETMGDRRGQAFALRQLAWTSRIQGQALEATLDQLRQSEALADQVGDTILLADIWYVSSDLRDQQGDLAGAEALANRMLEVAKTRGDERIRAIASYRLAKFALRRSNHNEALHWLDQADEAAGRIGWRRQLAWNAYRRGVTHLTARAMDAAETELERCFAEARVWGERRLEAYALQRLVEVYAATGRRTLARQTAEDVRDRFARQGIDRREFLALVERLRVEDALLAELLDEGVNIGTE